MLLFVETFLFVVVSFSLIFRRSMVLYFIHSLPFICFIKTTVCINCKESEFHEQFNEF